MIMQLNAVAYYKVMEHTIDMWSSLTVGYGQCLNWMLLMRDKCECKITMCR